MPRDDARGAALDARTMTPDWYARETRLAHMLPYVSLVDDQTVRTRVNELFRCIRLEGIADRPSWCGHRHTRGPRRFLELVLQHHRPAPSALGPRGHRWCCRRSHHCCRGLRRWLNARPSFWASCARRSFWACPSCTRWSGSSALCSCSSGVIVRASSAVEGRRLGPAFHRRDDDGPAGDTAHAQQVHPWRGQLCPVMTPVVLRSMPAQ